MLRNSKRSKPYSSLRNQNRHYRQKRAQFVKGLCASAHMNGSEFLIVLASPKGQVETFASEAFRPYVGMWFPESLLREARDLAVAAQKKRFKEREEADQSDKSEDDGEDEGESIKRSADHSRTLTDANGELSSISISPSLSSNPLPLTPSLNLESNTLSAILASDSASTPTSTTSTIFSPNIPSFPPHDESRSMSMDSLITPPSPKSQSAHVAPQPAVGNRAYIPVPDKFYESKFAALQQKATKRIAKAWIKVIEPKKQTRFPYNKGDASKPSWWPRALRHKEPDHLKSQERTELLISILRSPLIRIEKLEMKTAEEASFLQQDKIPLLREIYRAAREDERARDLGSVTKGGGAIPIAPSASSITPLKRRHPEDSDSENFSPRPPISNWKEDLTVDVGHGSGTKYLKRLAMGIDNRRNFHIDNNLGCQRESINHPASCDGTLPRGPLTFQPLHGYNAINHYTGDGRGNSPQASQDAVCVPPTSVTCTVASHSDFIEAENEFSEECYTTQHATAPLASSQRQLSVDPLVFQSPSTSKFGLISNSTSEHSVLGEGFQSSSFPHVLLEDISLACIEGFSAPSLPINVDHDSSCVTCSIPPSNIEMWQDFDDNNGTLPSDNTPPHTLNSIPRFRLPRMPAMYPNPGTNVV